MSTRHISRKFINQIKTGNLLGFQQGFKYREIKRIIYLVFTGRLNTDDIQKQRVVAALCVKRNPNYFIMIRRYDKYYFINKCCFKAMIEIFNTKTIIHIIKNWIDPGDYSLYLHVAIECGRNDYAAMIYEIGDKIINTSIRIRPDSKYYELYCFSMMAHILFYSFTINISYSSGHRYSSFEIVYMATIMLIDHQFRIQFQNKLSKGDFREVNHIFKMFKLNKILPSQVKYNQSHSSLAIVGFTGQNIVQTHFDLIDENPEYIIFAPTNLRKLYIKRNPKYLKYLPCKDEYLERLD